MIILKKLAMRKLLVLMLTFCIISCHKPANSNRFFIQLDAIIQKNDSIQVFYKKDGTINFNEIESFWTKVKGLKTNQKIAIKFPENIKPNQFRIDFGRNSKQPEIILNKLECSYKAHSFVLKGKEIYQLLRVDINNTVLDPDFGILKRKYPSQPNGPSLYPNGQGLKTKLEDLIK